MIAIRLLLLAALVVACLVALVTNGGAHDSEKSRAREVIGECRRQMDDSVLSASTREAARFVCNGLRNSFVAQYGIEP